LKVIRHRIGGTVIRLSGVVNGEVAPQLGSRLRQIADYEKHYRIVVVMSETLSISSRGLAELIGAWKTCRRWNRGDLRLADIHPKIAETLDLTGLNTVLDLPNRSRGRGKLLI